LSNFTLPISHSHTVVWVLQGRP